MTPPPPNPTMDEKASLLPNTQPAQEDVIAQDESMARPGARKSRFQIAAVVILLSLFWLARTWNCDHEHLEVDTKVPMDVHIMSKCPDARQCLKQLVVPTMANVSDKVDFRLSFIGRYIDTTVEHIVMDTTNNVYVE